MATTTKKNTKSTANLSDVIAEPSTPAIDLTKTSAGHIKIDDSALINVKSNVFGELFYIDAITRERFVWSMCGEILTMPMSNLRHMKNNAAKFYSNQLIIITGFADENAEKYEVADIYKALYITQYYKNILDPSDYAEICSWTPTVIKDKVSLFTPAAKQKLMVALNTYIEKGIIDSYKLIKAFEEALGCELARPE